MNYAFVPGRTRYERIMNSLFNRMPNTDLIPRRRNLRRVDQFIDHLETSSRIARPVGELFICSHGNDGGFLQVQLANIRLNGRRRPETHTTYEVLEEAVRTGVVNIPSSVLLPRPVEGGNPVPAVVHIKGCKIGQTEPFVRKLKEAFGGQVAVTAPKHFHQNQTVPRIGVLEHLGYDFAVKQKTPFRNKAELVTAFQNENFRYFENTAVPDTEWDNWIPRNIRRRRHRQRFIVNLATPLQRNATHQISTIRVSGQYRHDREGFTFTITNPSPEPGNSNASRLATLRQYLGDSDVFKSTHPFPIYERYEYASLNDFIDGFTWRFTWARRAQRLTCVGRRHRYTMIVPVTNPTNNNLCLNFYPNNRNPTPVIRLLPENDPRFFLTV